MSTFLQRLDRPSPDPTTIPMTGGTPPSRRAQLSSASSSKSAPPARFRTAAGMTVTVLPDYLANISHYYIVIQDRPKPRKAGFENFTHQVPPPYYSVCCHSSWIKRSEQLTLVRWCSCADLLKKGSCWYADVISLRKLNMEDDILKTYLPWFCATL